MAIYVGAKDWIKTIYTRREHGEEAGYGFAYIASEISVDPLTGVTLVEFTIPEKTEAYLDILVPTIRYSLPSYTEVKNVTKDVIVFPASHKESLVVFLPKPIILGAEGDLIRTRFVNYDSTSKNTVSLYLGGRAILK